MDNKRVLVFSCCDEKYSHYIPLFCATLLFTNENVDIEICVSNSSLMDNEEKALLYLREQFKNSQILIRYNCFKTRGMYTHWHNLIWNEKITSVNTVRFLIEPVIKNEYTYITDIDHIIFENNFYNYHLNIMQQFNSDYSNWIRPDGISMTGLHFTKTNKYYPIDIKNLNIDNYDEQVLYKIVKSKSKIFDMPKRPLHGLHMTLSLPFSEYMKQPFYIELSKKYKSCFLDFLQSEIYNNIKFSFDKMIINHINTYKNYYDKQL